MASVGSLLGNLMVASWVDSGLFAIQIFQVFHYFDNYNDPWFVKALVISLFSIDVVGIAGEYATIYLDAITHFGDLDYLNSPEIVPRSLYLIAVQLAAFQVQLYLITRIQKLTSNWFITVPLLLLTLLSLACGLALVIINIEFSNIADRSRQRIVTGIWLVGSAVVDVIIAVVLAIYLGKAKRKSSFKTTRSTLTRLIANALETGSFTAILALLVLVLFYTQTRTNWPVAFVFLLGRAYSITLMFNLNVRSSLKARGGGMNTTSTEPGFTLSLSTHRRVDRANPNDLALGRSNSGTNIEIQVAHSAVTKVDDDSDKKPVSGFAF